MVFRNILVFVQANGVNYSNTSKHVTLLQLFSPYTDVLLLLLSSVL